MVWAMNMRIASGVLLYCRRAFSGRQLVYRAYGDPSKSIQLETVTSGAPKNGEVLVRWLSAPINPADINQIQGVYPVKPPLPAVGGNEGCGIIESIGEGVLDVEVGSLVIPSHAGLGTWRTHGVHSAKDVACVDNSLPIEFAATLQVNPSTAYRMLKDFVNLNPGDVVIQNGANSAVGRYVIQLCKLWSITTVNVVRKRDDMSELVEDLKSIGADYVVTQDQLMKEMRGKFKNIKLALNCVGGRSARLLSLQLAPKAYLVSYGGMSKEDFAIPVSAHIFKDIRSVGFWMSRWYDEPENEQERKKMHDELSEMYKRGELMCPKFEKNAIEDFEKVLEKAQTQFDKKQMFMF